MRGRRASLKPQRTEMKDAGADMELRHRYKVQVVKQENKQKKKL